MPAVPHIYVKLTGPPAKLDRYVRRWIRQYLNEKMKRRSGYNEASSIVRVRGRDYRSAQPKGLVTVHGFLRKYYSTPNNPTIPEMDDKPTLVAKLSAAIRAASVTIAHAYAGDDIARKLVFALSPEMSAAWQRNGLDVDASLRYIIDETLERYRKGERLDGELGYAVGVHHDHRLSLHAHVWLMNHAENGKRLRLSNRLLACQPDGSTRRVDYLSQLNGTANSVLRAFCQARTPAPQPHRLLLPAITTWMAVAAADLAAERPPHDTAAELATLRDASPQEIVKSIDAAYTRVYEQIHVLRTKALTPVGKAELDRDILDAANQLAKLAHLDHDAWLAVLSTDARHKAAKAKKDKIEARLLVIRLNLEILRSIRDGTDLPSCFREWNEFKRIHRTPQAVELFFAPSVARPVHVIHR